MPNKNHGPQIKDDEKYEALRGSGMSKEKAARIANSSNKKSAQRGGQAPRYEDWSKNDLYQKSQEVGIKGRGDMTKQQLIEALRHH